VFPQINFMKGSASTMSDEILSLGGLPAAERARCGTWADTRSLSCTTRRCWSLRWFRDDIRMTHDCDNMISASPATMTCTKAIDQGLTRLAGAAAALWLSATMDAAGLALLHYEQARITCQRSGMSPIAGMARPLIGVRRSVIRGRAG
jgi:hypothetical protein